MWQFRQNSSKLPLWGLLFFMIIALSLGTSLAYAGFLDPVTPKPYVGISGGFGNNNTPDTQQDGSVTGVSTDEDDGAFKVFGGIQVTENVSLEASYHDFGESKFSGTSDGSSYSWAAGSVSTLHESSGIGLSTVVRYPVNDRVSIIAQLGWFMWKSTETWTEGSTTTISEDSGGDVTYGAGIEYDIGVPDNFVWRAELEHHQVDDDSYDINTGSAGIVFRFD